jgi:hypothetical protein
MKNLKVGIASAEEMIARLEFRAWWIRFRAA